MSRIILCACEKEAEILKDFKNVYVVGINTQAVSNISELIRKSIIKLEDEILNFGFVGSLEAAVGSIFTINKVNKIATFSPFIQINTLENIQVCDCLTCDEFQSDNNSEIKEMVVDMELYYMALLFPKLHSLKVVSDNLSENDFDNYSGQTIKTKVCEVVKEWLNGKD